MGECCFKRQLFRCSKRKGWILSNGIQQQFTIGNITFNAIGGYASNGFRPDKPIPESWIVDLSKPLIGENHVENIA